MSEESEKVKKRYDRISVLYDLLEFLPEKLFFSSWRKRLFSRIKEGRMLEVGVGTGKNVKYYPSGGEEKFAIDISEKMLSRARIEAEELGIKINFAVMDVEKLNFEDKFFDYVVGTYVFCSVADPQKGLKEIYRVLKPDGILLLLEHLRPNNKILGIIFDIINPLVKRAMGPNINRRTVDNIKKSGFEIIEEVNLLSDIFKFFAAQPTN